MARLFGVKGFSLIELMIVVAIGGILTSIAVPSYVELQNNSRRTEAKIQLSGLSSALNIFHAEWLTYFGEWDNLGYSVDGVIRYRVGFDWGAGAVGPSVPDGYTGPGLQSGQKATRTSSTTWCRSNMACVEDVVHTCPLLSPNRYDTDWFIAGACSRVTDASGKVRQERWSIDQNKKMRNSAVP